MADLEDILSSGALTEIKLAGDNTVLHTGNMHIELMGLPVPIISSTNAENNTIFFDPDRGQIRYKSPAGILMRFRMKLI